MANTIPSSNMALPIPVVGTQTGPQYATNINNCLTIIDSHTHAAGSGVQITPDALNINAALTLQGNMLTNAKAIMFSAQTLAPGNATIYVIGVDLYYTDGSGNNIRITQSGSVSGAAGTITGLPSGTASASYGSGTFVFQSATNTGANIDGASFILRNNTANSFGLTLSPPNAIGANYSIVLPTLPAQTNVMTLDVSGNMGSTTYNAVGQAMTATGANAIAASRTRATGTTVAAGGVAISNSSGNFSTAAGTPTQVTNLSVTITTSGRPVYVGLIADGSTTNLNTISTPTGLQLLFYRDTNVISLAILAASSGSVNVPSSSANIIDIPAAGTYTYTFRVTSLGGGTSNVSYTKLVAYEL